jgi:RNA polymerase primary sigma factor
VPTHDDGAAESDNTLTEVQQRSVSAKSQAKEAAERTNDPVRMYLREMSSVELLSREGEIAIAKRIEAGREALIAGLCESPLTFQSIIIWRDELKAGKVLLRDIIDLSASYAGTNAKPMRMPDNPLSVGIAAPGQPAEPPSLRAPAIAPLSAIPLERAAKVVMAGRRQPMG